MEKIEFKPIPTALLVPGQIVSDIPYIDDESTPVLLEFIKSIGNTTVFNRVGGGDFPYSQNEDGTISFHAGMSDEFYDVPQEIIDKLKNK